MEYNGFVPSLTFPYTAPEVLLGRPFGTKTVTFIDQSPHDPVLQTSSLNDLNPLKLMTAHSMLPMKIEPVSDWWSVGAILYKLITGATLFSDAIQCTPVTNHQSQLRDRIINGIGRRSSREKCKELAQGLYYSATLIHEILAIQFESSS